MVVIVARQALVPTTPVISVTSVLQTSAVVNLLTPSQEPVTGIAFYRVYRRAPGGEFAQITQITANQFPYSDTPLTAGTTYQYAVRAQDNSTQNDLSAFSNIVQITTQSVVPQGAITLVPGHIARTGSGNSTGLGGQLPTVISFIKKVIAADVNKAFKFFCVPAQWANLEGPTQGVYDGSWAGSNAANSGFAGVQQLINLLSANGYGLMISLNQSGNGAGANNNTNFPSGFAPAYLNNATYNGGCEWGGRSGYSGYPNTNTTFWVRATALRVAAMVKAYYDHFGAYDPVTHKGIYMWELTNEMSLRAPGDTPPVSQLSNPALVDAIINGYATIRQTCPKLMLTMRPTFVHPETPAGYTAICNAMFNAQICMGNEDGSNNFTGTNGRSSWGDRAYAGRNPGTNVVDPTMINYTQRNTWAHIFNVENAEYGRENSLLQAVPPADVGSGYILDTPANPGIMSGANIMGSVHIIWFLDGQQGPNCNRFQFPVSNAPNNPAGGPAAGTNGTHPSLVDVIGGNYAGGSPIPIPRNAYPSGWPV